MVYQKNDEDIMDRKKSNELELKEANLERSLIKTIRQRQPQFLGHICRHKSLEHLAVTGKIEGKGSTGFKILKSLNREEQTIIFRLRTGHNRLRKHKYIKLKIGESPICQCGQGSQSAEHILQQTCSNLATFRYLFWPELITLTKKLYGTTRDLTQTAEFAKATGLQI
ncbi:hypothetical protein PoB_003970400 [Plakobranchus ocellatus]|uniref:Uncharacterized protein n=1 Tax=Plakobranchus ocellatus TaxID=259542 RepID=A0AAV4B494_9GAST|nr:hypothetical protein PoB_003970400 [Plakobranchus ocellatus]